MRWDEHLEVWVLRTLRGVMAEQDHRRRSFGCAPAAEVLAEAMVDAGLHAGENYRALVPMGRHEFEEFGRYLGERHLPLVTVLPGPRQLVVNRVLPDTDGPPPVCDAVADDWFGDPQALGAALASPAGQAVMALPNFRDMTRYQLPITGASDPSSEAPTLWTWVAMFGTCGVSYA